MTDNEKGKVSIIIPAYNAEKYLSECIESVLNQTYENIEIIVINDGSTDSTETIASSYVGRDKPLLVWNQTNKGQSFSRTKGLTLAKGEYILFLDSDDCLEPQCCERTVQVCQEYDADVVIFEHYRQYSQKLVPHITYKSSPLIYTKEGRRDFFVYDMRTAYVWGKLYKRSTIATMQFEISMRTAEDVVFSFELYKKANRIVYINDLLMRYRVLARSAIHGYNSEMIREFSKPLAKLKQELCNNLDEQKAYYSFAGIAYIVICQNQIYMNRQKTLKEKLKDVDTLSRDPFVEELFNNMDKVVMPNSRKCVIYAGKLHLGLLVLAAIRIKNTIEQIRR